MAKNLLSRLFGRDEVSRAMTLDQYLQQVINGRLAGYMSPYVTYTIDGRPAETQAQDYQAYVERAYAANPIIFGLMQRRASVFSEARFCWRAVKNGNPGDTLPTDDGLDLLEAPWPGATSGTLLTRMIQHADAGGTAFVVKERQKGEDRLRLLRPDWTQIVLTGDPQTEPDVDFLGLVYTPGGGGEGVAYLPDQCAVWAPIPDPLSLFRGLSWITPVLRELAADQAATQHKLKHLEQGAALGPIVLAPPNITKDQFKQFVEVADSLHAGPNNAGKFVFLSAGAEIKTIASTLQQLDLRALTGSAETRLAVAAGVPAVIAGISEGLQGSSLNAGNYQAAKRAWIDGGLRPLWRSACEALANLVTPPDLSGLDGIEDGTEAQLWILESDIALLHEDRLESANVRNANATTINTLVTAGFTPESIVVAVRDDDLSALKHSGLTSVQLSPPGQNGDQTSQDNGGDFAPDTQGQQDYQEALDASRGRISRATGPWSRHPHPGRRYRHGYIPVSPLLLLPAEQVDEEYGPVLDSVDFGEGRISARRDGLTVESDHGADVAVHAHLTPAQASDLADAIDSREPYIRQHWAAEPYDGGVSVRFGDLEPEDLSDDDASNLAETLRDLGYIAEDSNRPVEPSLPESEGDNSPIPDNQAQRSYLAALGDLRAEVDQIRRAR